MLNTILSQTRSTSAYIKTVCSEYRCVEFRVGNNNEYFEPVEAHFAFSSFDSSVLRCSFKFITVPSQ